MAKKSLLPILEQLFGVGKISSKEEMNKLIKKLEDGPDFSLDLSKFASDEQGPSQYGGVEDDDVRVDKLIAAIKGVKRNPEKP